MEKTTATPLFLVGVANASAIDLMKQGRHDQAVDLMRGMFIRSASNPQNLQEMTRVATPVGSTPTPLFGPLVAASIEIPVSVDFGSSGMLEMIYPCAFFVPKEASFLCAVVTGMYTWGLALHCLAIQRGSSPVFIEAFDTYQVAQDLSFLLETSEAVGLSRVMAAVLHNMLHIHEQFFQRENALHHRRILSQISQGESSLLLNDHDRQFYALSLFFAEGRSFGHAPCA